MAPDLGLLILRLAVGLTFAAHGAQKAFGWWAGPGPVGWRGAMEHMGMRPSGFWAVVSTMAELIGGLLLALGLLTPLAVGVLIAHSITIVHLVHLPKGFWNTQGGLEYPMSLGIAVLAIGLTGPGAYALDTAIGVTYADPVQIALIVLGLIGAAVAWAVPRVAASTDEAAPQA